MKPSIGRIVIHRMRRPSGYRADYPAMITAVHSETCVNLTVFVDYGPPELCNSQTCIPDPSSADAPEHGWFWPPRVES